MHSSLWKECTKNYAKFLQNDYEWEVIWKILYWWSIVYRYIYILKMNKEVLKTKTNGLSSFWQNRQYIYLWHLQSLLPSSRKRGSAASHCTRCRSQGREGRTAPRRRSPPPPRARRRGSLTFDRRRRTGGGRRSSKAAGGPAPRPTRTCPGGPAGGGAEGAGRRRGGRRRRSAVAGGRPPPPPSAPSPRPSGPSYLVVSASTVRRPSTAGEGRTARSFRRSAINFKFEL